MKQPTPITHQPAWLKNFIPAPSDPALLTIEHVRVAFAGDWTALREIVRVAKEVDRAKQNEPLESI